MELSLAAIQFEVGETEVLKENVRKDNTNIGGLPNLEKESHRNFTSYTILPETGTEDNTGNKVTDCASLTNRWT